MVSVAANSSMLDFATVNADIAKSVKNLKAKAQGSSFDVANQSESSENSAFTSPEFGGHSVSYLEAGSSFLLQKFVSDSPAKDKSQTYAAGAYDFVYNINAKPEVLIDFMHEFNRNFDYTI